VSKCGRNGPQIRIKRLERSSQAVGYVVNPYHLNLKIGREDQENTVLVVSLPEVQSGPEDGGKRKGDPGKKARLVVPSFLYS